MALFPDSATARLDPFRKHKTLNINFFVHDPITGEPYSRDPRNVARKAEEYLASSGVADTCYFGAEAEFYIFDSIRFGSDPHQQYHHIDSAEGWWNTGREEAGGNLGYKVGYKGGYFPVPPVDHYADLRDDMVTNMTNSGFEVERGHHEVGTAGPGGDQLQVQHPAARGRRHHAVQVPGQEHRLARRQDRRPSCRSRCSATTARACTRTSRCGRTASRCSTTRPATAACRTLARYYIGGLLHHAPSLLAFTNPTVNSYHRLVPGFEAPVNLVYSARNRSACIRIPLSGNNPKAKRLEFRCPDSSGNPYLAFSAMMMAGMDGIKNKIEPPPRSTRTSTSSRPRRPRTSRRSRPASARSSTGSRTTTTTCSRVACSPRT